MNDFHLGSPFLLCASFQVKRSRENARSKRENNERLCKERERQNRELFDEVVNLRDKVKLLTRVRVWGGKVGASRLTPFFLGPESPHLAELGGAAHRGRAAQAELGGCQ